MTEKNIFKLANIQVEKSTFISFQLQIIQYSILLQVLRYSYKGIINYPTTSINQDFGQITEGSENRSGYLVQSSSEIHIKESGKESIQLNTQINKVLHYHDGGISASFIKTEVVWLVVAIVIDSSEEGGLVSYVQVRRNQQVGRWRE